MLLGILAAATASAMVIVTIGRRRERHAVTAKLTGWERHRAEYAARIVLFNGNAFLFGNAVFCGLDEILRRANDANNRKDAQRNREITLTASSLTATNALEAKRRIQASMHGARNIILATAAATCAFAYAFNNARAEKNGRYDLNDCGGFVFLIAFVGIATAKVISGYAVALKNANVALAAIKNYALFKHRNAFNFLGASCANASFKHNLYIKTNVDRVKSTVETNGIDINAGPNDFCALCANRGGAL